MDLELLIAKHAESMAAEIPGIAQNAQSEEEVRHGINSLLDAFMREAGIKERARHEYGLAGGFIDSKYGGVILEYKSPKGAGRISPDLKASGTRKLVEQIRKRFVDFHNDEGVEPNRLFAVGSDGKYLLFVRHRGGKLEVDTPQPVSRYSLERWLRALVSLGARGLSFTPEQLTEKFGADSQLAQDGVAALYAVIAETANPKACTFFSQWKILFGEVCGYDVEGGSEKIKKLGAHYGVKQARPAELLFAVHTYYAIFMKFLAAEIVASFAPMGVSVLREALEAPTSEALQGHMRQLEQGGIWSQMGISNFLEGDLFSWYLDVWDERAAGVVKKLVGELERFDPTTLSVEPTESRDLLKRLYQNLFPKSVRHDLGEYYTPDWLAEHVLNELEYDGNPDKRLLDPACGSGTFLVLAVSRAKQWFDEHRHSCGYDEAGLVQRILTNIIGFDLNPLAVMAARTNYLLAIRDLLRWSGGVELPVYLCDSIMTPAEYGSLWTGPLGTVRRVPTAVGDFHVPTEVAANREHLGRYADAIEHCINNGYDQEEFVAHCEKQGIPMAHPDLHRALYAQLLRLNKEKKNGLWARIIKNAFAPLFVGKVHYLAGNPPWVNWESLPEKYRKAQQPIWQGYGLFTLSGSAARLGGGKKDLSMLFVYVGADHYLEAGGRVGFVITQSVFKTTGAGDGFRQFRFPSGGQYMRVKPLVVHDLSAMQVFEGATNRTAVFVAEKTAEEWAYPVPYVVWRGRGRVGQDESLERILSTTNREVVGAVPVEEGKLNSPWLTAPVKALPAIRRVTGRSSYRGYAGSCTWLNGVYWVRVVGEALDGQPVIQNLFSVGKSKVRETPPCVVEKSLVYPLLRGRDVGRWRAEPVDHILMVQDPATRAAIPEGDMRVKYSGAYAYLKQFEKQLRGRSGYRRYYKPTDPFYSMYNVGPYTVAAWKVMWPEVGNTVCAGVRGPLEGDGGKPAIPDHTIIAVSCEGPEEAHYLCAALNCAPVQATVSGYIVLHPSPHVLEHVAIPRFQPDNLLHQRLSDLSRQCHEAAVIEASETLVALEAQVDEAAAELWGLTEKELRAIQEALRER